MTHPGYIKCKYCDFKTPVWRTGKSGKKISGWAGMADHVRRMHPEHEDEADRLVADLRREEE